MFNEVKEMLDATIYSNGNGEITAQNVNLAMHGIVDATEEKISELNESFAEVDTKIDEVYATIDEVKESGLGGITLKFPMLLMELLYEDIDSIKSMELTSDFVAIIGTEYPGLVEPLNQLIADNVAALEKIKATVDEGKEMPFVAIDFYALYKEIASILGDEDEAAMANLITSKVNLIPTAIQYLDYSAIMPSSVGVMGSASMGGFSEMMFTYLATGEAAIECVFQETPFIVPAVGGTADNSANILFFESSSYADTYASNRKHVFVYNDSDVLTPLSISGTSSYVYATFLIGRQFVKTTFNLTDGVTTSELLFEV